MIPMTAKLNANAPYEDQRAPRARHSPIDATTSGGGTLTSSTSSVMAMAYTPSQNAASLPVPSVNPQLLPHRVDSFLGRLVHHDLVRPLARETLLFPFARRVDSHLGAEREPAARVVQHVDRPHREPHVALGVDVVQRHPPRLLGVAHVHVLVEHHDHLGERHQPLPHSPFITLYASP